MARDLKAKIKIEADTKGAQTGFKKLDQSIEKTGTSTSKLGGIFSKFNVGLIAATAALAGLVAGLRRGLDGAKQQEDAVNALNSALSGLGDSVGVVSAQLQKQADQLQATTKFSNESVIEAQAVIAAFTNEASEIEVLTAATLDLATAKGISLASAADLLAKSFGSSTNALSRYGVEVEGAAGSQERLLQLTEGVADLYGGRAADAITTFSGATAQLGNNIDDLLKLLVETATTSEGFIAVINGISDTVLKVTKGFASLKTASNESGSALKLVAESILPKFLSRLIGVEGTALQLVKTEERLRIATEELAEQTINATDATNALAEAEKEAAEAAKAAAEEHERYIESLKTLGIILVDNDKLLLTNEQQIKDLTQAYDEGKIGQDRYLDGLEALNTSTLDIIESNRNYASNIRAEEIPAVEQATRVVLQQTAAVEASTQAKLQNVQATRQQVAAEQEQRGAGDSSTQIGGGTFTIPSGSVVGVNGRVSSVGGRGQALIASIP